MKLSVSLLVLCLARTGSGEIPLMPEALEMELALSAAPQHLRSNAAVLLLGKRGPAFINSPAPHGMIIVPLGKEEQKAIQAEHEARVNKVREFLER